MSLRPLQAITTKYLPPTNVKGSRIKASASAGSLTIHLDHALSIEANHAKAAEALANKWGWNGQWFMGGMPDDRGYCFVHADILGTIPEAAFTTAGRK
jgi:hypothetical protein